jgi:hypothetical protein
MKMLQRLSFLFALIITSSGISLAQKQAGNLVFVDGEGVLRFTSGKKEAAFFGVNYTVPFAYGYRSHKALGVDLEKAIDADVYHLSRLGLDAFRVHVWDVEISDSAGNLLENEHLRLFDYLLMRLREKGIRVLITPIAFWGNGYPERDEKTPGFATKYGKGPSVVNEDAIRAQENYLRQFFQHINPYTKQSYRDDQNVIATEINNEPHHSGPRERTTEYINRLAAAIRGTGWTKPVFYNISESPSYAGAVAAANVDGHSFQWYPTNLVANHEQRGNFLPHVDQYKNPFLDSLPNTRKRARIVYEFDAGDVLQPIMYPAMARSFRTAGFQWATQFAYDPMATAYANTEYQTHFLNLAYTPAKAISLLIASKAFHEVPRGKSYGVYPSSTSFENTRISYEEQLSEWNVDTAFFHSNNTGTKPNRPELLRHIAGVGSSPVVQYDGNGAWFLDKIGPGKWRLEVMPDAIVLRDPFGKASPSREAERIIWNANNMSIHLPDLGQNFRVFATSEQSATIDPSGGSFKVRPGVYELSTAQSPTLSGVIFYAPASKSGIALAHQPRESVSAGNEFSISLQAAGLDTGARLSVEIRNAANKWKMVPMTRVNALSWSVAVPADMVVAGLLEYRVMVWNAGKQYTYPAETTGDPYAWDALNNETWKVFVRTNESSVILFDADKDRERVVPYITDWRNTTLSYPAGPSPDQLLLRIALNKPKPGAFSGWQQYIGDRLQSIGNGSGGKFLLRGRGAEQGPVKLSLVDEQGTSWSTVVILDKEMRTLELPLANFQKDSTLLLPRPYPGFQPLWFAGVSAALNLNRVDRLGIYFGAGGPDQSPFIEIESIWYQKP